MERKGSQGLVETGRRFDPTKYLRTIRTRNGSQTYLPVPARLLWLRSEHPDASVVTEALRLDERGAVFKATIAVPHGGTAVGHASEVAGDAGDFIEKAETKAIGRALSALGYGNEYTELQDDPALANATDVTSVAPVAPVAQIAASVAPPVPPVPPASEPIALPASTPSAPPPQQPAPRMERQPRWQEDERPERADRNERIERAPERNERNERAERTERMDRPDRVPERMPERNERPERIERAEPRIERTDRTDRADRFAPAPRGFAAERPMRPERMERVDRAERSDPIEEPPPPRPAILDRTLPPERLSRNRDIAPPAPPALAPIIEDTPEPPAPTPIRRSGRTLAGRTFNAPTATAAPAPAPEPEPAAVNDIAADEGGDDEDGEMNLAAISTTGFWRWAKSKGYADRRAVEAATGKSMDQMTPREAYFRLREVLAREGNT